MANKGSCPKEIEQLVKLLMHQIKAADLPDDYSPGDSSYPEILANIRHEYTNYEELLNCLNEKLINIETGDSFCWTCPIGNLDEDRPECVLEQSAHDELKYATKAKAKEIYQHWLDNKKAPSGADR